MRIAGGILSIIGGIVAVISGILLAAVGSDSGIGVLLLGVVATAGGICALARWNYVFALIGAICVVVAKFFFAAEFIFFILGIPSLILIIRSRKDFTKLRQTQNATDKLADESRSSEVPVSPVFCPKCGKENLPSAKFCSNCGDKLISSEVP